MPPRLSRRLLLIALPLALLAGGLYWKLHNNNGLPADIASGNGRLEATEIDIASRIGGRLASVDVREGDTVQQGQVVAALDAADLQAQLRAAAAQVEQAQAATAEGQAAMRSAGSQHQLAHSTLDRTRELANKGFASRERLDRDLSTLQTTDAAISAAQGRVNQAQSAVTAAQAQADAVQVTLDDATLKAPVAGRVLYRLAEPGEVLAPGGKVITLLDMSDTFMSIYLSTSEAGKVRVGSEARIVLDALPNQPIPAHVVFVAPRAQFTPKEVETRDEREKLMFRIKVKVDQAWLANHADLAKPGMPGMAYVKTLAQPDSDTAWPANLTPK